MPFWNRNKINKKMIPELRPTSKASLKQMCLYSANGDIDKAQKLYDYMIKDMEDLPMFDIVPPTKMQQVKSGVNDVMQWMKENQDQILLWADLATNLFRGAKSGASGSSSIANTISNATNSIPNINQ